MTATPSHVQRQGYSLAGGAGLRGLHLATIAALALTTGVLVYLSDRDSTRALLMPALPAWVSGHRFGVLGLWLPSFLHTFAFSLLTVVLLPAHSRWCVGACGAWAAINLLFEFGQHPRLSPPLAQMLHSGLGDGRISTALAAYFLRGTFDVGDIAAAALGAVAALALTRLHLGRPGADHET